LPAGIDLTNEMADHLSASTMVADPQAGDVSEIRGARDPRRELAACMAPLIAELPAPYREAIILTEFRGMTQAAAADRLGLSVSGMKSRVQRARGMLRNGLTDCCRVEQDRRGTITGYRPGPSPCPCQATAEPSA
jgi:RNA polymerase sigma-70 factor (ECF subfamily)